MRIGILGSGLMGGKLGTLFARAGHDVVFSYSHSQDKLKKLARKAGKTARAGTPADASRDADAVLLAVHWSRLEDVLHQAGDLKGKVIVTCSLPMSENDSTLVIAHASSGAEALAWGVMFVVMPLSGIFYPVESLPTVLQPIALALPTTHAFAALRGLVDGNGLDWAQLGIAAAETVGFAILAGWFLVRSLRIFRRRGLITRFT